MVQTSQNCRRWFVKNKLLCGLGRSETPRISGPHQFQFSSATL